MSYIEAPAIHPVIEEDTGAPEYFADGMAVVGCGEMTTIVFYRDSPLQPDHHRRQTLTVVMPRSALFGRQQFGGKPVMQ